MIDDDVESLKARLAALDGPSRVRPLLELGQELANRYVRVGPGSAAALPELNAAIEALNKAYQYFDPGDPLRGQVACQLGWLMGMRHIGHGGASRTGRSAFSCWKRRSGFRSCPVMQAVARIVLGPAVPQPGSGWSSARQIS